MILGFTMPDFFFKTLNATVRTNFIQSDINLNPNYSSYHAIKNVEGRVAEMPKIIDLSKHVNFFGKISIIILIGLWANSKQAHGIFCRFKS